MNLETVAAVLSIIVIDLTISGDNALVIGMAAHSLPPRQRRMAILFGSGGAVVLRVTFAAIAALLLTVPFLQATGGVLLGWIAFKLLLQGTSDAATSHHEGKNMMEAVRIIILADLVMSLDNILAVAGASHGNVALLAFGLALSIPIVMFGSNLVAIMLNRHRWLIYLGVGVLVWTSGKMIVEDRILGSYLPHSWAVEVGFTVLVGLVVLGASMGWRRIRSGQGATA